MPIAHHIAAALLLLAPPRPRTCDDEVAHDLRAGRHKDAAARGERCWNIEDDPRALDLAIQARTILHHGAHAAHDLRLYARHPRALESSERRHAEHIRPLIVTVTLTLGSDDLDSDVLRLRAAFLDDRDRGALLIPLTDLPAYDRSWELELDPGRWLLELLGDDNKVLSTQDFTAANGLTVTFSIPKAPAPPPTQGPPTSTPNPLPPLGVASASPSASRSPQPPPSPPAPRSSRGALTSATPRPLISPRPPSRAPSTSGTAASSSAPGSAAPPSPSPSTPAPPTPPTTPNSALAEPSASAASFGRPST